MTQENSKQNSKPKSWAEDLNSYRSTRGTLSLSAVNSAKDVPPRFCRTTLVPFLETKHPLFSYNDFWDKPDLTRPDPKVQSERYERHGWGDPSLLKQDGYAGVPHARGGDVFAPKASSTIEALRPDGRTGLFEILQQQNQPGVSDVWFGNPLIDPTKGKRPSRLPDDPKGRKDLFDVLHARNPGMPSDDSWLGHSKIDPAKGKAHPMGPEERRGRRDLQDIFTQSLLHETVERRAELIQRGADPLGDGWIGNQLVDPRLGKLAVSSTASSAAMIGATFRPPIAPDHCDLPRRHARQLTPPCADSAHLILNGSCQAGADDDGSRTGRRPIKSTGGSHLLPRHDNLYAHMTFRPLSELETRTLAKELDDSKHYPKRAIPIPGSLGGVVGKGPEMLHHDHGQRVGMFIPYAGLAQSPLPGKVAPEKSLRRANAVATAV